MLEDVIFAKDLKIIALNDRIISFAPHTGRDGTIEPSTFLTYDDTKLWAKWREEAKDNPNMRKKYTVFFGHASRPMIAK